MGALLFPSNRSLFWSQILDKECFFCVLTIFPLGKMTYLVWAGSFLLILLHKM